MINGIIPIEINQSLQVLLGGQLTSKLGSFFFITRIEPAFIKEGTFTGFLNDDLADNCSGGIISTTA